MLFAIGIVKQDGGIVISMLAELNFRATSSLVFILSDFRIHLIVPCQWLKTTKRPGMEAVVILSSEVVYGSHQIISLFRFNHISSGSRTKTLAIHEEF